MTEVKLFPGWRIVREIGRGSFGTVYEIERELFGQIEKAALKVISFPQDPNEIAELYDSGYDRDRVSQYYKNYLESVMQEYYFMTEMRGHPSIVYCDDVRYEPREGVGYTIYIKMELLTPLLKYLEQLNGTTAGSTVRLPSYSGPANYDPEVLAEKMGKDLCQALILCKGKSIIHRDIKPQNIFVSDDGHFKLGDFGIAKTIEKTTGGTKIGTYNYMAPEVYNNRPYGQSADIYSLGLVLYWLLNERRGPFLPLPPVTPTVNDNDQARIKRFSGAPLPPPVHGSAGLRQIVLKACAFDPKDRFASPEEMLAALEGLSAHTDPVYAPQPERKPAPASTPEPELRPAPISTPEPELRPAPASTPAPGLKPASDSTPAPARKKKGWIYAVAVALVCLLLGKLAGGIVGRSVANSVASSRTSAPSATFSIGSVPTVAPTMDMIPIPSSEPLEPSSVFADQDDADISILGTYDPETRTYTNEWISDSGIGFRMDQAWTIAGDDEIAEINSMEAANLDEALVDMINAHETTCFFFAETTSGLKNVALSVIDMEEFHVFLSESGVLDRITKDAEDTFTEMGMENVSSSRSTIQLAGAERPLLIVKGSVHGMDVFQTYAAVITGHYAFMFTVTTDSEETAEEVLSMFYTL